MGEPSSLDTSQYNMRSPGVKRLMKEAAELRSPTDMYFAQPLEDNLFEWHFTVRGPADTDFDGGIYHGRILLPADYPMKPPSVILLTPNGRFQLNQKICLSISGHHPESWQPSWSIRTALLALIGFMPTHSAGALGSLEYPPAERKKLAIQSRDWTCKECGLRMGDALAAEASAGDAKDAHEARELASQISFKNEYEEKKSDEEVMSPTTETTLESPVPEDPSSQNGVSSEASLRQRASAQTATTRLPDLGTSPSMSFLRSSVRPPPPPQHSSVSWHLVFMFILGAILAALVYRRIFISHDPSTST